MPFFADTGPGGFQPKRKFRFTVEIQGVQSAQGGATLWYAKTCSKPAFQIANTEHKYLNHTFFYPGAVTWQDELQPS